MSQAASAMTAILITSLSIVRHNLYEIFLNLHRALAVIVVIAIGMHVPGKPLSIPTIFSSLHVVYGDLYASSGRVKYSIKTSEIGITQAKSSLNHFRMLIRSMQRLEGLGSTERVNTCTSAFQE
jgi:hypothetical protein